MGTGEEGNALFYSFAGITSRIDSHHPELISAFVDSCRKPGFPAYGCITAREWGTDIVTTVLSIAGSDVFLSSQSAAPGDRIFQRLTASGGRWIDCVAAGNEVIVSIQRFGVFRITSRFAQCEVDRAASPALLDLFEACYRECVIDILLRYRGKFVLDASSVSCKGHRLALIGPSGSGKSTAAIALLLSGFRLLSDDRIILGAQNGCPEIASYGSTSKLELEVVSHFRLDRRGAHTRPMKNTRKVEADLLAPGLVQKDSDGPLALLLFPHVSNHAGCIETHAMSPAKVFVELIRNIQHKGVVTRVFLEERASLMRLVAESIPGFSLIMPRDLATLANLPPLVERLVEAHCLDTPRGFD